MGIPSTEDVFNAVVQKSRETLRHLDEISKNAVSVSEELLLKILSDNADTEYGKKYDFAGIKTAAEYKSKVPFSTYEDYGDYITRMYENGEKNLITAYPIVHYALSSGSVGVPKHIPVSKRGIELCSEYALTYYGVADEYLQKKRGRGLNKGHSLASLEVVVEHAPDGATQGCISAATIDQLKVVARFLYTTPECVLFPKQVCFQRYLKLRFALPMRDITVLGATFMTSFADMFTYLEDNWKLLADDIEKGVISDEIDLPQDMRDELAPLLAPDPERAAELRAIFEQGFENVIPKIWTGIDVLSAIGTGGFTVYTEKMRRYLGDVPIHFELYAASEAIVAVATGIEEEFYTLIPDSGFYEFIPEDAKDETQTLTLDKLEEGKNYEIVITNVSGLYRYRIGDVVRVSGYYNQTPRICFMYRKNQLVSIAGEKTDESMIKWAVSELARETGDVFFDYSVYADTETSPGRYVLFVEPKDIIPQEKLKGYRDIIEDKLSAANPSAGAKIKSGALGSVALEVLQQQTYYLHRDQKIAHGVSENQMKPVRVISKPEDKKFFFALRERY
ncbi:plant auxin-responsive GH3 [Clostridia bacterium]|nr:plant auxin-responsive GH3 [Clostridia bacterium]